MATKIYNINEMRDAIVFSHNEGLKKAIDKNVCKALGIDMTYFTEWVNDVNKLKAAVDAYIKVKNDPRTPTDKERKKQATALRKEIFPLWKELLTNGEAEKDKKELHVDTADVESLIGYDEEFCYVTDKGRCHTLQTETLFRKKVEFLLGCKIAQNQFMDEDKRDLVTAYQNALHAIDTNTQLVNELKKQKAALAAVKAKVPEGNKDLIGYLDAQIKELEEQRKAANKRIEDAQAVKKEKQNDYDTYCACLKLAAYDKITVDTKVAKQAIEEAEAAEEAEAEKTEGKKVMEGATE